MISNVLLKRLIKNSFRVLVSSTARSIYSFELLLLMRFSLVDSGHLCCRGYNEVVMLRRLPERHKHHALKLLTGTSTSSSFLYGKPHDMVRYMIMVACNY